VEEEAAEEFLRHQREVGDDEEGLDAFLDFLLVQMVHQAPAARRHG
jgi:hypothetical protein